MFLKVEGEGEEAGAGAGAGAVGAIDEIEDGFLLVDREGLRVVNLFTILRN